MTTATSEASIRGHLKRTLEGVSDIGVVYDYERWAVEWKDFLNFFKTTIDGKNIIRGWTITCESMPQEYEGYASTRDVANLQTFIYKIRGYFSVNDTEATEKSVMGLVFDAMDGLDKADSRIDDGPTVMDGPASLDTFEYRLFGTVLCHYAEITQQVIRRT